MSTSLQTDPNLELRLSPSSLSCLICDLEINSLMLEINSLEIRTNMRVLHLWVCMSSAGGGVGGCWGGLSVGGHFK